MSNCFGATTGYPARTEPAPNSASTTSASGTVSLRTADDGYCPATGDRGHLELALYRKDGSASPAGHLPIPGQISAAGSGKAAADLTFTGSPMERFMTGAFDRTLGTGCTARVMNP